MRNSVMKVRFILFFIALYTFRVFSSTSTRYSKLKPSVAWSGIRPANGLNRRSRGYNDNFCDQNYCNMSSNWKMCARDDCDSGAIPRIASDSITIKADTTKLNDSIDQKISNIHETSKNRNIDEQDASSVVLGAVFVSDSPFLANVLPIIDSKDSVVRLNVESTNKSIFFSNGVWIIPDVFKEDEEMNQLTHRDVVYENDEFEIVLVPPSKDIVQELASACFTLDYMFSQCSMMKPPYVWLVIWMIKANAASSYVRGINIRYLIEYAWAILVSRVSI